MFGSFSRRSSDSRARGSKALCPGCASRNARIVEKGSDVDGATAQKAYCPDCGHFFTVSRKERGSTERAFGEVETGKATSSRDVWLIRIGVVVAVATALALGLGIRIGMSREESEEAAVRSRSGNSTTAGVSPETQSAAKTAVAEADHAISSDDRAIRRFLGKFLGAGSWRERLPLVRHPEVTGIRMSRYYENHDGGAFEEVVISTQITRVGSLMVLTLEGKGLPSKRLILEERAGGYFVDWESFVLWQDKAWAEIPSMTGDASCEIRCLAKPLPNNHPARKPEDGWLAFELVQPVTREILFGYYRKSGQAPAGSPAETLEKGSAGPVTLAVRSFPGAVGSDQVLISEILALGWVHPLPDGHRKP